MQSVDALVSALACQWLCQDSVRRTIARKEGDCPRSERSERVLSTRRERAQDRQGAKRNARQSFDGRAFRLADWIRH